MPARVKRVEFLTSFDLPSGVTVDRARQYVTEAVGDWCKSLRPPMTEDDDDEGDPLFHLDASSIKVRRYKKPAAT